MTQAGRIIALAGLALLVIGLVVWGLGRLGFRGLPGDIVYEGRSVRVYVPIVTCLVASIVLSVVVMVLRAMIK